MSHSDVWAPRTHAGHAVPLAWVRLLVAYATITRRLNASMLAVHGLTVTDYEVLLFLSWAPEGRLRRSDLAQSVLLTQGGITRLLKGLEDAGLVTSVASGTDRRVIYAQLTGEGRKKLEQAAHDHVADVNRLFTDRYSAGELAELAELLDRLPNGRTETPVTTRSKEDVDA